MYRASSWMRSAVRRVRGCPSATWEGRCSANVSSTLPPRRRSVESCAARRGVGPGKQLLPVTMHSAATTVLRALPLAAQMQLPPQLACAQALHLYTPLARWHLFFGADSGARVFPLSFWRDAVRRRGGRRGAPTLVHNPSPLNPSPPGRSQRTTRSCLVRRGHARDVAVARRQAGAGHHMSTSKFKSFLAAKIFFPAYITLYSVALTSAPTHNTILRSVRELLERCAALHAPKLSSP